MLLLGAVAGKYASDLHLYYLTNIMCILITEYICYTVCACSLKPLSAAAWTPNVK